METDEKSKLLIELMNQMKLMNERLAKIEAECTISLDYIAKFKEEYIQHISLQTKIDKL